MLAASYVGGETAAVPRSQIIGNIHTAIGWNTLTRGRGVTSQVKAGDYLYQGDVIETGADGQVGIRFIDGTLFNMACSSCVVVSKFACDAVASIRPRHQAGGLGMLTLTALTFVALKDAEAADPNVTFMDDDSITYKDLHHGAFELTTKEPNPRHIIVDDPGETVELHKIGSSVSVNQFANTASRMEELQGAQQDVLSNLLRGPNGSSTPPFVKSLSIQPINFVPPDSPSAQHLLVPLPSVAIPVPDEPIVLRPTLDIGAGPTEFDTVVFDTFKATSGTFVASTNSGAKLTFGISGGTAGSTVLDGATYDVSQTGAYGTLYLNSTSGAYIFIPNSDSINALKTNTTQDFLITVSDGTFLVGQTFGVAIIGVEDAAIISGTTTGSVVAASGVATATPSLLIATGTLADTDPDDPPNTFTTISSPMRSAGGYGVFTMTPAGVWTYSLDSANTAVLALDVGTTLTDSFIVTSIDGTPTVVTITIHGPMIAVTGTGPSLTLSETHLTATALDDNISGSAPNIALMVMSGDFSTAFASIQATNGVTISYALSITGGNGAASGLIDSHTGLADVLVLSGNTIEGHVGTASGALAFAIMLDPTTGLVTFTEYRAVTQPFGTSPDDGEGVSLAARVVNLVATVTDKNGSFQTVSVDIGTRLTVTDDGPTIATSGTAPSLTLSETNLTKTLLDNNIAGSEPNLAMTTTSGDFATAFTSVQGADGATISYALSITSGNGTASGLIDSQTGQADVLVSNGNEIDGYVGTTGTMAFMITLDPKTGLVTFTEYRAVTQPLGTNPDGREGVSLTTGIVSLTATITDKDGDFRTASLDLGSRLTVTDDGPTIGGFSNAIVAAQDNQVIGGTYSVKFGADGESAMRVAIHDGAVNGYNLATTDLGGGITSVHVTGNDDDYTFYYTTHALSGGVELDAFFTLAGGTLRDSFFKLVINPDGTYKFDVESVGFLRQVTVSGSDFGASSSGQSSLTAPDGLLVITGNFNGAAADVKASNNGIAVGDTGLQMDQHETLLLTFAPEQTNVSFSLTQWQGNGTADIVLEVHNGATDVHDFSINIPKSSGDSRIVVEVTSIPALVDTYAFDGATSTYTVYVGSEFNQIGVSYDNAVAGNATFTVNNITYSEPPTIPSTDLLFDVTAVDRDGDSSTSSLQVDLLGSTNVASSLSLSGPLQPTTTTVSGTSDGTITSGTTTGFVIEAVAPTSDTSTATATTTLANTDASKPDTFTAVSAPTFGYGAFTMTAAGVWTYALDSNNFKVCVPGIDDALTYHFTATSIDGTAEVVTIPTHSAGDSAAQTSDETPALGPAAAPDLYKAFETSHSVTIANGGDAGQIVPAGTDNGTVDANILHDGSDNDAINGSESDDTNHVGWGNVAIDGSHRIIDGFGANQPSGDKGSDRFTYLTSAHSTATEFDNFKNFEPGYDKLDLTALGALLILALSATSTTVPAHTIAWLYDSSANETIVYVNLTDHTLQIGDSSLLEVHLQGVASIEPSNSSSGATAVPLVAAGESLDASVLPQSEATLIIAASDSTLVADSSTMVQTTDPAFSFQTDPTERRDYLILASLDVVAASETDASQDDSIIFSPAISQHARATISTETNFTLDKLPASSVIDALTESKSDLTSGSGPSPNLALVALNLVHQVAEQHGEHELQSGDSGPSRSSPLNAKGAAHAHEAVRNDSSDDMPGQGMLRASQNDETNHSPSIDSSEHGHSLEHGASGGDRHSSGDAAHATAAVEQGNLGDSFQFRLTSAAHTPNLDAESDHSTASSGHHGNANGAYGGETAAPPELWLLNIPPHAGHGADVHVAHDLIV